MIPLLDKLRALRASAPPLLGERTAGLLEWPAVTDQVASFCRNALAAERVRSRLPLASRPLVALWHELSDGMDALDAEGTAGLDIPLVGRVWEMLRRPAPLRLDGGDLVAVAATAEDLDAFRDRLAGLREAAPAWGEAAVAMTSLGHLGSTLRRCLEPDGRIADAASGRLAGLRRRLEEGEREIRREVQQAMSKARGAGWTTADEVTLRGDRYCLPLRSGDSRRVPGIVHDRSDSGATLFVEPAQVVSLANGLVETRMDIAAEEARILLELNRAVEAAVPSLLAGMELVLLADEVRAARRWSRAVRGHRPTLDKQGLLRICAGRHPLLIEALGRGGSGAGAGDRREVLAAGSRQVVTLDLELVPDQRALVISGPNAGGKSVALKTVGVFCLLAWCGWDVPAREDTVLPVVGRVLADLGDEQSISRALSSFSAHLSHLARFLELADPSTLVLCDEIGTGTDPQEGTALAFAVLEDLVARGARVLASTHFGLLKAAVHDHPRMVNAAMDYDERDLRPLFTLRVGDPGTSHAFDIAERMGLPPDLLERARARAGDDRVKVEKLLADLDRRSRELAEAREGLERERTDFQVRNQALEERLRRIDQEKKKILAEARRQAEELAREGRRAIENAVREIRSTGADRTVVRAAREKLRDLAPPAPDGVTPEAPPVPVAVGDRVRIPHLNLIGRVVEVRGERLVALADNLRLTLDRSAVRPLEDQGQSSGPDDRAAGGWSWHGDAPAVSPEIDLRGMMGQEAWDLLDRLIDRAIPAGLEVVRVIHGHGTGRLRDHLRERLKSDPRVAAWAEAAPSEGGGGVTLVHLGDR